MSEKKETYPKEWYDQCCEKYAEVKEAKPKGKQWLPIQQGLKKLFSDGEKPEDVMGCMEYIDGELDYNDWTIQTVWKKMADYKGWKKKQKKKEEERKERKWQNQDGPSLEEVKDFKESFFNWKEKSAHGDSPWAFEFYLNDAGVITFTVSENGWKKEVVHDVERYEKAWELHEALKGYEDSQITAENVSKKLDSALEKAKGSFDMPQ